MRKAALVALMSCKGSDGTGQQQRCDEDGCLIEEGGLGCTDELQGQRWGRGMEAERS